MIYFYQVDYPNISSWEFWDREYQKQKSINLILTDLVFFLLLASYLNNF